MKWQNWLIVRLVALRDVAFWIKIGLKSFNCNIIPKNGEYKKLSLSTLISQSFILVQKMGFYVLKTSLYAMIH